MSYLCRVRGIDRSVVKDFAERGLIYEDAKYHNAVFVGCDDKGVPRHAHKRAAYKGSSYKCSVRGSEHEHSFHHNGTSGSLYVFEAPIDMLSFISMYPDNWREDSYVALCSVAPGAVLHRLECNPEIRNVYLCLDSDEAGQSAEERIARLIGERFRGCHVERLVPQSKDWNEDLCGILRQQKHEVKME